MMRSLFAGVSGLKVHQTRMDSIGNNIANINTVGFKSSRTTFADMLSQTQSGASAPSQNLGGTNPKQIGLGVAVASIDLIFSDGSPQSTGKNTDMALSGNGLFVVKNGDGTYYTRDGAFSFDEQGYLVLPGSGLKVQGWNAIGGSLNTNSQPSDIIVPTGKTMEAQATTEITFSGNLNANEPLIVSIDGKTTFDVSDGHGGITQTSTYKIPKGSAVNVTLSNGKTQTIKAVNEPLFYTVGRSIPKDTILQVYDSQGMAHNVPIKLEKTQANTWLASLSGLTTAGSYPLSEAKNGSYIATSAYTSCYSYIKEVDGTYTRVSFVDGDTNTLTTGFKIEFDSKGQPVGNLSCKMRLEYNFDAYPPGAEEPTMFIQRPGSLFVYREGNNTYVTANTSKPAGYPKNLAELKSILGGEGGSIPSFLNNVTTFASAINGADVTTPSANFIGLTQYAGSNSAYPSADGNVAGNLVSVSVDTSGVITGTYTNGLNQFEAQVAVAQFTNTAGLVKQGNSLYAESNNSGTANIKTAPDLGLTITPSALEMSNVDLANEFSEMIITQRGFQANSKIINVGDEMLETLVNMKR